ncbi:hypothetical protein BU15DRAFT_58123 [Melanogaster broomeanus]|nr:hypothetical protein BU15DRAFT_58123 [Melanogaster broomeanus]
MQVYRKRINVTSSLGELQSPRAAVRSVIAFGALIASVVMEMADKVFGFAGWRSVTSYGLFLLEGSVTIIIAVFAIFVIPDYPSSPASWLTPEEHLLALRRMEEDGVDADSLEQDKQMSGLIEALSDSARVVAEHRSVGSRCRLFLRQLLSYTRCNDGLQSDLTTLAISWHSDVSGERFWHISIPLIIGITGFVLAMSTMNTVINVGVLISWVSNSFPHSSSKRAVSIAIVNSVSMIGNIGAAYFWPSSWGPSYFKSYLLCILAAVVTLVILWRYRSSLEEANKAAEEEERLKGLPVGFRRKPLRPLDTDTYNRDGGEGIKTIEYQLRLRLSPRAMDYITGNYIAPPFDSTSKPRNLVIYKLRALLAVGSETNTTLTSTGSGILFSFKSST